MLPLLANTTYLDQAKTQESTFLGCTVSAATNPRAEISIGSFKFPLIENDGTSTANAKHFKRGFSTSHGRLTSNAINDGSDSVKIKILVSVD
jgi:hypothetical protein